MASPDIAIYNDLTLYDKTPTEIYDEAVEYAQIALPEFEPHTGSIENALLQATSLMTGELAGAINRMGAGAVEVILQLLGITRDSGSDPSGSLTVTVTDSLGHVVPAGTRFGYRDNTDPTNPVLYTFDTDEDLTIPAASTTGDVDISGVFRQAYPQLEGGQVLQLLTPVAFIQSAVLDGDLSIGSDPETDAEYFSRALATLNSYSAAIILPDQFDHYILSSYSDVYRVKTYSRVDSSADTISGWTPDNGYVTIYTSGVGGASLAPAAMTAIKDDVEQRATAGLIIDVVPAYLVTVPVAVTFTVRSGYAGATVRDSVEAALGQYIHPDYWDWASTIYLNEIISLVDQVDGVDRVVTVTINSVAANYNFAKFGTLPVGVFTVSQT